MMDDSFPHDGSGLMAGLCMVALAVLAAGCIGSEDVTSGTETVVQTSANDTEIVQPATFPVDERNHTTWSNGSFSHAEVAVGQADRQQRAHRVSLDHLPENVPVWLEAKLEYTAPSEPTTGVDHADVFLDTQIEEDPSYPLYRVDREESAGSEHLQATLVAAGSAPPELVVLGDLPPAAAELSFTLRVQAHVAKHVVPANVATAIEVPAEAERVEVVPTDASEPTSLRAWTPDDVYLGKTDGDGTLSFPAPRAGSYVAVPNATSVLRVIDDAGEALDAEGALQAVGWQEETGEPMTVPPGGSGTWTGEVTRAPLAVGFTIRAEHDQVWAVAETTIEMAGPSGDLPRVECSRCFSLGVLPVRAGFDDDHAAGTYELTVDSTANADLEVLPRWIHYER